MLFAKGQRLIDEQTYRHHLAEQQAVKMIASPMNARPQSSDADV